MSQIIYLQNWKNIGFEKIINPNTLFFEKALPGEKEYYTEFSLEDMSRNV